LNISEVSIYLIVKDMCEILLDDLEELRIIVNAWMRILSVGNLEIERFFALGTRVRERRLRCQDEGAAGSSSLYSVSARY